MKLNNSTPIAALGQIAAFLGKSVPINIESTLNRKFGIIPNYPLSADKTRTLNMFCIGNGAASSIVGEGLARKIANSVHSRRDMALYNHIPFCARRLDNALTPEERVNLRLRRIETHNGDNYEVWYGKLFTETELEPTIEYRTTDADGNINIQPYEFIDADLNPTPDTVAENQLTCTSGTKLSAYGVVTLGLNKIEIEEVINACMVIYQDKDYANISEIALCSSFQVIAEGEFTDELLLDEYLESSYVQTCNIITDELYKLTDSTEDIIIETTVGVDILS